MKYYRLFILFIAQSICFAQNNPDRDINTTWAKTMASTFQYVEKNRVPHGILLDYGMYFTNMSSFTGSHLADSNHITMHRFNDIYSTLVMSRIREVNQGFVLPDELATRWQSARKKRTITLSGLYFEYAQYKKKAYTSGLVRYRNGKVYDVYRRGKWQNPYETTQAFAIAPSVLEYTGLNVSVTFPQNLWLCNQNKSISRIEIDFDDGLGYRPFFPGTTTNLQYKSAGVKQWKYRLTKRNKQQFIAHSLVSIAKSQVNYLNTSPRFPLMKVTGVREVDSQGRPTVIGFLAEEFIFLPTSGVIRIQYKNPSGGIVKPLIIAEGIDHGHITKPEAEFGAISFDGFIKRISYLPATNDLYVDLLENPQYDLIYLEYGFGATTI